VTAERAEASAGRNQLERAIRDLSDRRMRLERQMDEANRELSAIGEKIATLPDPDEKRAVVEAGEIAVAEAEAAIQAVEQALAAPARPKRCRARRSIRPVPGSTRIETEARTISRMLACRRRRGRVLSCRRRAARRPRLRNGPGCGLGDDLESPLDPNAPPIGP
jgi:chromosome segregation protein